ncbi:CCA tRNA nucleotidyltransferase [Bacillus alveayuensis]|jgi:tRNA nucleotidyltransferase (CCA-adding enzyme)|uniref:CCA tRNA nucleotidyltransferase n=1 Tax=Aeribacillus alveayuensis TaxID=279215 RepID=UPI0005CCD7E7|nr:CCA tRNA nucleotidyltransferase [Bacillus alveayuensis]
MDQPFLEAKPIIETLNNNGFEAYFVGGSVRDYLMGREIGDIDIATSATPNDIKKIFEKTIDVGAKHGTIIVRYHHQSYEVTTFRQDCDYKDFRRPTKVQFVTSLKEDLKRRDFTMNAIAMDQFGNIFDFFHGRADIKRKIIRTVGEAEKRFSEDALRMLRAVRFVSQLSFQLHPETKKAIQNLHPLLENISVERKTVEFEKLLKGPSVKRGIELLMETNIYQHLPGFCDQKVNLRKLLNYSYSHLQTSEEYWTMITFVLRIESVESFLRAWKLPGKIVKHVRMAINRLPKLLGNGWTSLDLYQIGLNEAVKMERVRQALQREFHEQSIHHLEQMYRELPMKQRNELCINGKDLVEWFQKKPGPWISSSLAKIEERIIKGELPNEKEAIKEWLLSCNRKFDENC